MKGTAVKSTIASIKERLGEREEEFIQKLPAQIRPLLTSSVLVGSFYDSSQVAELMEATAGFIEEEPEEFYVECGRSSADFGLTTVYRLFLKIGSPEFIIKKAPLVWRSYYSEGILEVFDSSSVGATVRIREGQFPHCAICGRIQGWMQRTMELSGAKAVVMNHTQCTFQGGDIEEWQGHWNI